MSDVREQVTTFRQDQPPAPKLPQSHLAQQLSRMEYIATAARAAMDELSNTYTYGEFKTHMALADIDQLRQDAAAGRISPEEEVTYRYDTEEFLKQMLEVIRVTSGQILQEQQRVSDAMGDGNLIDDLRSLFLGD